MSFRKEWKYSTADGRPVIEILAKNGAVIAECKTKATADKIIRGLELVRREEILELIKEGNDVK